VLAALPLVTVAGLPLLPSTPATAATSAITIVGTSDVSDSGLIVTDPNDSADQSALVNAFERAYPQYTLNYIGKGTGDAIAYAENGQADGLIVHAESLENQFVDPPGQQKSFSAEKFGRAVFYGDFVLAGNTEDPAQVGTDDPHDIVGAFAAIAEAGQAGNAEFVSRGGTPGTTVEEHQIWAYLVGQKGGSHVPGVTFCKVPSMDGGGYSPSTSNGDCPVKRGVTEIDYPAWYHVTGLSQAPNVEATQECNFGGSSHTDCYVFTDRGTFDDLKAQQSDPIPDLSILSQRNAASSPGGKTVLTNYFHAYAVDAAAVAQATGQPVALNTQGAETFIGWLSSPAAQRIVGAYLQNTPGGAPFTPDAQPKITLSSRPALPARVKGTARRYTVTGRIRNVAPATPPLAHQPVTIGDPQGGTVATTTTDGEGRFTLHFHPSTSGPYAVRTPTLAQLENASLDPAFSDLLSAGKQPLGAITVVGDPQISTAALKGRQVTVNGTLSPVGQAHSGVVTLLAGRSGHKLRAVSSVSVPAGHGHFTVDGQLPRADHLVAVSWGVPFEVATGTSPRHRVSAAG
jgi:ABC-type tungstate transport system permease subunit